MEKSVTNSRERMHGCVRKDKVKYVRDDNRVSGDSYSKSRKEI